MSFRKDHLGQSNRSDVPTGRFLLLHHPILYRTAAEVLEANAHFPHVVCRDNDSRLLTHVLDRLALIGPPKHVACAPLNRRDR